jgi:hypothetical protein
MKQGEINGPFNVKLVAASLEQRVNYLLDAAFFPEPPEDQLRSDEHLSDKLMALFKGVPFSSLG